MRTIVILVIAIAYTIPIQVVAEPEYHLCTAEGVVNRACLRDMLQKNDTQVNKLFDAAIMNLQAEKHEYDLISHPDETDRQMTKWLDQRIKLLEATQPAYLNFRKAICDASQHAFEGGSYSYTVGMNCLIQQSELRLQWLNDFYAK